MEKDVLDFIFSPLEYSCLCWDRSMVVILWWGIHGIPHPSPHLDSCISSASGSYICVLPWAAGPPGCAEPLQVAMVLLLQCPAAHRATLKAAESTQSPELTLGRVEKPQLCF